MGPQARFAPGFQKGEVLRTLEAHNGVGAFAAAALGMYRANFHRLAKCLGIKRPTL